MSHKRLNVSSGTEWETQVGYSRAVRVGQIVEVAGTTAVDEAGHIIGQNDPYEQTRFIIDKIKTALEKAGASLEDVVRTRLFVVNINHWPDIGRAHGDYFRNIRPVATMVEVSRLIDPALLVEIEATAIIETENRTGG